MSNHDQPVAANLLAQEFVADAPNQRWVADTTEFVIGSSGKLYLAAVLHAGSCCRPAAATLDPRSDQSGRV